MRRFAIQVSVWMDGQTPQDFTPDSMLVRSVERMLHLIGEAARRVPLEYRVDYPDIPWRSIVGMRNFLSHEYDDVETIDLWTTATQDMEPLIEALDAILGPNPQ